MRKENQLTTTVLSKESVKDNFICNLEMRHTGKLENDQLNSVNRKNRKNKV